ncbi:hypothetical protein IFM89_006228 [Coptis chinensis]|uniref:Translation elongation factor EFTu-like domain-containing protein n=1 Tax=Coptis chinensis TaxID=261450 RepID=A0A835HCS0_9MAGN|nr:hypothetical protein IFM89_006228 [Coptis chinensis]
MVTTRASKRKLKEVEGTEKVENKRKLRSGSKDKKRRSAKEEAKKIEEAETEKKNLKLFIVKLIEDSVGQTNDLGCAWAALAGGSYDREEQLDFPVLYASDTARNMSPLLDAIVNHVPPPTPDIDAPFLMLVSMMERDFYLGRILTGRISSGIIRVGDRVHGLRHKDSGVEKIEEGKVIKLMKKKGTSMVLIESAGAGDIISMAGLSNPSIGHTVSNVEASSALFMLKLENLICFALGKLVLVALILNWPLIIYQVMTALPIVELDPPTIPMTFGVNDSPLAGRDGTHLTGGKIGDRLMAEAETNLAINVLPAMSDTYEVQGRGELQLGEVLAKEGISIPWVKILTEIRPMEIGTEWAALVVRWWRAWRPFSQRLKTRRQ